MKPTSGNRLIALALLALTALNAHLSTAHAQGTAFTYQGLLQNSGAPASGTYNLTFSLFNASSGGPAVAGPVTTNGVIVTNGQFTALIDFGPGVFSGAALWLEIGVETNLASSFTTLTQRQQLTPTPYAIYSSAAGAADSATTATIANGVSAGAVTGAGIASGQVVKSLNGLADAVRLSAGANVTITPSGNTLTVASTGGGGSGWSLTGNSGTIPGTDFLGTTDPTPLELWVNSNRLFRLEPLGNVVGGSGSSVAPFVSDATIGGGLNNTVSANSGNAPTIAGGTVNTVSNLYPTISGGEYNKATANGAFVGGGYQNTASGRQSAVTGGNQNIASADGAVVAGGGYDGITQAGNSAGGPASVVGGGLQNGALGTYDTVPGGSYNVASGGNSFAAGHQAQALHAGSFVWADATGGAFPSTAVDQFSVRAEGGVRFVTAGAGMTIDGVPVATGGGGGGSGWSLTGNGGTTPGVDFLGTTDGAGLELHVNSLRGMRLDFANVETSPDIYDSSVNMIGGSWLNTISPGVVGATIAGGGDNHLDASDQSVTPYPNTITGDFGYVGGGYGNTAGQDATVPGGYNNIASGDGSFAAGQQAQALHNGAFVWADASGGAFQSTNNDSFNVRAIGGVRIVTGGAGMTVDGQSVLTGPVNIAGKFLWTAQAGAPSAIWQSVASSSDGTHLVAGISGGQIYTSADSGVTWTAQAGAPSANWWSVASSSDGTHLVAVVPGGQIYTSADSGVTWTAQAGAPSADWQSVASSSDGTHLVAGISGGQIYTSADSGVTWTAQAGAPSAIWQSVASSSDGTHLVAVVRGFGGQIYTSADSGVTWTAQAGALSANWWSVASSSDGTHLVAGISLGQIYTSADSGVTWTAQAGAPTAYWLSVASSSDGTHLVAVAGNGGQIYTSADSGATWTAQARAPSADWVSVASSSDGTHLVAVNADGQIYTGVWTQVQANGTWMANNGNVYFNGGNVGIGTGAPGNLLVVGSSASPAYCNGTTWVNGSDRNSKESFRAINPRRVLEKVSALPITEWQYKLETDGTRHLGPVAQDFHAAFGLNGADDKHIATVDEEGVALAAIQGLNQKVDELKSELNRRDMENAELKQRLAALERIILNQ